MRVWLDEAQRGLTKASVDGEVLDYGEENAIIINKGQYERLEASNVQGLRTDADEDTSEFDVEEEQDEQEDGPDSES